MHLHADNFSNSNAQGVRTYIRTAHEVWYRVGQDTHMCAFFHTAATLSHQQSNNWQVTQFSSMWQDTSATLHTSRKRHTRTWHIRTCVVQERITQWHMYVHMEHWVLEGIQWSGIKHVGLITHTDHFKSETICAATACGPLQWRSLQGKKNNGSRTKAL